MFLLGILKVLSKNLVLASISAKNGDSALLHGEFTQSTRLKLTSHKLYWVNNQHTCTTMSCLSALT